MTRKRPSLPALPVAASLPPGYVPASARNMVLLVQLRWLAVFGQLITIVFADAVLDVRLPLVPLIAVPVLLVLVNFATIGLIRSREGFADREMLGAVLLDVAALGWQLYFSGGSTNPFTFLFLLQIAIGVILLPTSRSWIVALAAVVAVTVLTFLYKPLDLPPAYAPDPFRLYLLGSLVCFALNAWLLVHFVIRMGHNRRQAEAAVAALSQQAAEERHIVRMGLLASGAAHELGTPMSSMSVILGDWAHHPAIAADPDLRADVVEMETELRRCKSIVSGILMSAGEVRGENPSITTLRGFVQDIAADWRERSGGEIRLTDELGEDVSIVADPALRQVIGNVIDNALEVSPGPVDFEARRTRRRLFLDVRDHGPGFAPEMLESFGKPYSSTKGRAGGGLGLFLVVNVVRKLGGTVDVANLPDGGARVRLAIPLASLAYDKGARG
ncbi:ATP-binding protein [Novosphingobium sp. KCTC 2891]|uniref:ATP-binding protein n=1 Tax=Novosphingobium sp. KCTC 2891 TaxID=2989730 RepID=UPI00222252C9|nr:ATP-binding protein [Novosphingobium sp. KCTC 2891]MCW1384129.1 ATP-binding protein [Novosphingobium sp. KCTC 2891]